MNIDWSTYEILPWSKFDKNSPPDDLILIAYYYDYDEGLCYDLGCFESLTCDDDSPKVWNGSCEVSLEQIVAWCFIMGPKKATISRFKYEKEEVSAGE